MAFIVKSNFSTGELSPRALGRVDVEQYYNAAESLRNCVVLPEGGFRRRDGTLFKHELAKQATRITAGVTATAPNGGTAANANDDSLTTEVLTTTDIGVLNPYVVVHYDLGSAQPVQYADVVGLRNTVSEQDFSDFFIQYSTDNIAFTSLGAFIPLGSAAKGDRSRRKTGPITARYWRVVRIGATDYGVDRVSLDEFTLWTQSATLSMARLVPFEFSASQRYMLLFTDRNIAVFKDGVKQTDIRSIYTSAQLSTYNWTQSLDTLIGFHGSVRPTKTIRQGSDSEWQQEFITFDFIPKYQFTEVRTLPPFSMGISAVDGTVTVSGAGFDATYVSQHIDGNGGRLRVSDFVSAGTLRGVVLIPFFDTTSFATGAWTLIGVYEDAWSDARGWPMAGVFYQNRLWYGGTTSLPGGIWGSRSNTYYDIDPGIGLDDDAISTIIQADDVPAIYQMRADRHLQIFTSSSEYYVPIEANTAITPTNFAVRRTTSRGIKQGPRTVNIGGETMFVQRNGKTIRRFLFNDAENAYVAPTGSILSSHLINDPVDIASRSSTSLEENDLIYLVNSDGEMSIATTLREESVNAWVPWDTDGNFLNVGVVDEDVYVVVERTINSVVRRYLELFDPDIYVDCGKTYTTGTTLTGLPHLEAKTLRVRADDSILGNELVAGGQITIDRAVVADAQVGLFFRPFYKNLPITKNLADGTQVDGKKRVRSIMLQLYNTQEIRVNGQSIVFRGFGGSGGGSPLDAAPPIYTGRKEIDGLLGWDDFAQIEVDQETPSPMTVLLLEMNVRI